MEAYNLILVFLYASNVMGVGTLTPNARCYPRLTAVPLDGPTHNTFPYFMELLRCSGSWKGNSPKIFECVADQTQDVIVKRFNLRTLKMEKHTLTGKDGNHTSCTAGCTITPEQCPAPNVYDPERCTCSCNHKVAPTGHECAPKKSWSHGTCSCHCAKRETCKNRRATWSKETCGCVCKPKRRQTCTFEGGVFDETTCLCKSFSRKSSQEWNNNNGKFVGSHAFWCYILIGEFIVMLFIFDMILFCKRRGMLYHCLRKCRTVEDNDNESTEAIEDGTESVKTSSSSLQSIIINTNTTIEPPNKHGPIDMV